MWFHQHIVALKVGEFVALVKHKFGTTRRLRITLRSLLDVIAIDHLVVLDLIP